MDLSSWFNGSDYTPGPARVVPWAWVTIVLSAAVVIGYGVIAVGWYFQSRLADREQSRAALTRLRGIALCSLVCGYVFFATDLSWAAWRLYDAVLALLAVWTWSFVL